MFPAFFRTSSEVSYQAVCWCRRVRGCWQELTYRYMAGEGGTLSCAPSADTVAGNGGPLSWTPSADAVAGNGTPLNWRPCAHAVAGEESFEGRSSGTTICQSLDRAGTTRWHHR